MNININRKVTTRNQDSTPVASALLQNTGMDPINALLKQVIDGSAMRHRALANNIANADTPGYRRRDVSFISELRTAIQSGKPENIANVTPTITTSRKQKSIELEREFADLSENHLLYQTSVDVLSRRYARLRSAISGRV